MKRYLFIAILLVGYYAKAQDTAQLVPGTKISLVPPEGFLPATNFTGFLHPEKGASLMVVEIPGPFDKVTGGMTADNLKKGGMQLITKDTIVFQKSTALLMEVTQAAHGIEYKKMMLLFGDTFRTTIINAVFPKESEDLEQPLKKSLLTSTYNAAQVSDPVKTVLFEIHPEPQGFKFANGMMGMLSYTLDGKPVTKHPDNASFMVGMSTGIVAVADQKAYAIERFKKLPGAHFYEINTVNPITINELHGIELLAVDQPTQGLMYQVMLFTEDNTYYLMIGMAINNAAIYQKQFKTIARTFKRK